MYFWCGWRTIFLPHRMAGCIVVSCWPYWVSHSLFKARLLGVVRMWRDTFRKWTLCPINWKLFSIIVWDSLHLSIVYLSAILNYWCLTPGVWWGTGSVGHPFCLFMWTEVPLCFISRCAALCKISWFSLLVHMESLTVTGWQVTIAQDQLSIG